MKTIFMLLVMPFFLMGNSSFAGDTKDLQAQLDELKRINATQATNLANALNQLQEVLANFQSLTGRVDQTLHDNEEQAKLLGDNQKRLDVLEEKAGLLVKQLEEIKSAGLMSAALGKGFKEFQEYQQGLARVNAEEYKEAVNSLRQFMATYPKSPLIENAQFWIGQSFYSLRDFPAAVSEFQKVISKYPTGSKAATSLLKQGYAFFEMQSFDEAKAFLNKLIVKYPSAPEAVVGRDKLHKIDTLLQERARH